jgi:hypothetical protein
MGKSGKRTPRFRRVQDTAANMVLTSRDLDIIHRVARLRIARSTHLLRLIPGPRAQLLRRLRLLYHHGWLDRPRSQLDYFHQGGGSQPMAYCLGRRGAILIRSRYGPPTKGRRWEGKGAAVGRIFLDHTLAVTDALVEAETACRESAGRAVYVPPEALRGNGASGLPFSWDSYSGGRRTVLIPDAVFGLELPEAHEGRQLVVCCLEADRGTMPVIRGAPHQSGVLGKLQSYARLWREGKFENWFGTGRLMVIIVTPGARRCLNIKKAVESLPYGRGIFGCWDKEEIAGNFQVVIRHAENRRHGAEKAG